MTKVIIGSTSGNSYDCEDLDLEPLQRRLQELLRRKRYLLVLDDLWDEEQENWLKLKSVLACGGKGASILVTTRLPKVAEIMGTVPAHKLSMLSDKDCWELFKQRAFGPNEVELTKLVAIGKEILKKCRGVPLAAITLGSLLRFKREEKEWIYVKDSKLWSLQGENSVMQALRLSYLYLPVKLRQCFAFSAIFPKDELISKQLLIELWVANGFISSNESLEAEDIGDEVWNELYWSSFFQDVQTDKLGMVTHFKMHDLVHDLAQSFAEEICCSAYNNGIINMHARIRHFSVYGQHASEDYSSIQLHHVNSLKTYIEWNFNDAGQLSPQILKFNSLRVLRSNKLNILSASIGRLKYLRYLDISHGMFKTLPQSLCRLCNLQVLKLDHCYDLQSLPDSLTHLKSLQQLSLRACYSLSSSPPKIGTLTSLRTLSIYVVGKKRGYLLEELGQLNLKGELHIKHLERVKSVTHAKEANMSSKHLNQLRLSWGRNEESQLQGNVEQILEVLQPHTQQLDSLGLRGYTGTYFPQWMSSPSLKGLTSLEITDCKNCLLLPKLGKLSSLKNLKISNMSHVVYLWEESYNGGVGGLMALETLILEKLPNLIRLSREDGENIFMTLSVLEITECPNLSGLPCLPSLKNLYLYIEGKYNQDLLRSVQKFQS
ncbi:putative P-loop containing nucleoside triphosphate hydrolase, leucine-rich repeat domain, L [Medicago truncatula]|uniref:Putative P-loop containing nucleoside triphosphate hydrolase, leucine-rich repeat domain, L n=1 Tax=Medicago truncatula TaxID=3880 RepID=A0A396HPY1_MEDTR|nr:putative disease resistance protein RGA3 [Medicago truncatula]RHN55389.1 putative P-loop containing nucleoside triphosphate hydrolase, leucine-rich repeat domain, L [Medicago truncatula]